MSKFLSAAIVSAMMFAPVESIAAGMAEPKTAAAVQAADDAWGEAEANGDAGFVDQLLLPGYRSIGPTGKATSKTAIVDGVQKRGRSAAFAAEIAQWKANHPSRADVAMFGDTAILTWVIIRPGSLEPISSSDVFVYRRGHWRAIYSQHTSAPTA